LLRQLLNKVKASADAVDVHEAESSKSVEIASLKVGDCPGLCCKTHLIVFPHVPHLSWAHCSISVSMLQSA